MKPTCNLRFREHFIPMGGDMGSTQIGRTEKVLQQLWQSDYVGEPDEWRDVEGQFAAPMPTSKEKP